MVVEWTAEEMVKAEQAAAAEAKETHSLSIVEWKVLMEEAALAPQHRCEVQRLEDWCNW